MAGGDGPDFGAVLRRYRLAAGLTQEELAERAHLSVRGITDLERGVRRVPRPETVALLVSALVLASHDRATFEAAARRHRVQLAATMAEEPDIPSAPLVPGEAAAAFPPTASQAHGGFLGALPTGPLVGREPELRRLLAALDSVAGGQGRLLLLAGEPGVGKTRLAQELMLRSQAQGFRALTGRCDEQYTSLPFFPFVEVLTTAWHGASPVLRQNAAARFAELGRLLPLLLPMPPHAEVHDPRLRLLHTVSGFLQALAAEEPLALLLDDLHCADSASLELLVHLARALRGDRVLLLGTYRDVEVGRQHHLESTLTTLTRDRVVDLLTLRGLPPAGTAGLIRVRFGIDEVSEELRDLVHERTEGNPFFTEEVLSALVEQGAIFPTGAGWDRKAVTEIAVPQSIRSVVGQRVGRLPPEGQELLRLASVLGQEWELAVLLGATDQEERQALAHLEAALGMNLLEERRRGRAERYGFVHALIAQTLYEEVPRFRLRRLHVRAGEALERLRGERPEAWAELARHFLAAGDEARALRYSQLAGDHAAELYAHAEAVQHYEAALELLEEGRDTIGVAQVRTKLGSELRTLGRYDEALAVLEQAAATWQGAGDLGRLGDVMDEIVSVYAFNGAPERAVRRLQEMLPSVAALGPSPAVAQLATAQAGLLFFTGQYHEYLTTAELAAEMARALGDSRMAARAGYHHANALQILGHMEAALRVSEETIAWAQEAGEPAYLAPAFNLKTFIHTVRGEFDLAGYANQQGVTIAERQDDAMWLTEAIHKRDMLHFYMGEWVKVRTSMERALAVSQRLGWPLSHELLALGRHCLATGQWQDAARHLEEAIAVAGDLQVRRRAAGALAELDVLERRPAVAVDRLVPLLDRPGLEEFDVTYFLPVLAWSYVELGELAQAEETIAQAIRRARAGQLRLFLVDALRVQAMLAGRHGRWTQAMDALEEGLALARAMPYPYAEARILHVYGVLHAQQERPEAARERLGAALGIFRRLGARKYIEQVERDLAVHVPEA